MIPPKNYPYAIRVTSEIMESNGSTSMASVCGGTLALHGRRRSDDPPGGRHQRRHLHRIQRRQEFPNTNCSPTSSAGKTHYCDMDCKIAGTEKGITGFQLDLKLNGIPHALMAETVEKARVARLHILAEMAKTLAAPRTEMSKYAPRIETIKINPGKDRRAHRTGRQEHQDASSRNPVAKSTSRTTAR